MATSFRLKVAISLWLLASGHQACLAQEDAAAQFYRSKGLSISVGASAGGGIDLYARLVARHIAKHLPGSPTVVVQNMPGAGGLQQMNHLGSIAAKDGSFVGMINPMMTVAPILTPDFAKYDPARFSWIGSVNTEIGTCTFWPASKLSNVDQLKQRRVKMGGIGAAGGSTLDATTLREVLGFPFDIVLGYPGMTEATLAAERGEVDGVCGLNVSGLKATHWEAFKRGDVRPLLQTSVRNHPDLPNVANVFDLATSEAQRQVMRIVFGPWAYGRPLVAPPGTDAANLAVLRRAFQATMKDAAFVSDAERIKLEISPMPPEEISTAIKNIYQAPPDVLERTRVMLTPRK
jgi:tripartite-type tricarboxylate transporter receptor subunit TctC